MRFDVSGPLDRHIWLTVGEGGWGEWGVHVGNLDERLGFSHRVKADN